MQVLPGGGTGNQIIVLTGQAVGCSLVEVVKVGGVQGPAALGGGLSLYGKVAR